MSAFRSRYSSAKKFRPDIKLADRTEFPDLSFNGENTNAISSGLDFLEASKKPVSEKKEESKVMNSGWVELSFDSSNNVIWRRNDSSNEIEDEIFQKKVQETLSEMISRWTRFKTNFEELNGEDMYHHYYSMEHYYENFDQDDE